MDGTIHRAAGPALLEECCGLGGCPPGQARITRGYRLIARHVIHTVGPIWQGGVRGAADTLASCYRNSLALAVSHGLRTVAFPAISCGIYGYPSHEAARIAIEQTAQILSRKASLEQVWPVCFDDEVPPLRRAPATDCSETRSPATACAISRTSLSAAADTGQRATLSAPMSRKRQ